MSAATEAYVDSTPLPLDIPPIAFIGRAGAGKTTAAQHLADNYGYHSLSFATPIKEIAALIWGDEARTDRSKLQPLGVKVREIDENAWVKAMVLHLEHGTQRLTGRPVVIDDCRFPNEAWTLKERGFQLVRIIADEHQRVDRLQRNGKFQNYEQLEHESETALDDFDTDYTVWNVGKFNDLADELCRVMNAIRARI